MRSSQRVVVIGAGVIGLSVAWRLAEPGADVTIVEADRPGAGTSATSFAWVNASSKAGYSAAYFELNALALQEHYRVTAALDAPSWFVPTGDIELASGAIEAAALERKVRKLRELGYAAEMLSAAGLDALEPGTAIPGGGAAAFYREEGWADTDRMVSALLRFAREAGAKLIEGDPVREILQAGGVATGIRSASGATIEADVVVVALGRWTSAFLARLGIDVPLVDPQAVDSTALGLLARIAPAHGAPHRLLHSRDVNWSPLPAAWALLASGAGDAAVAHDRSPASAEAAAQGLIAQASLLNPRFEGATVQRAQVGVRALPTDGVAVCGWIRQISSLYVVVTHSGVTLSPLLGGLAAHEVATGRAEPLLASFRPDRFLT